MGRDLLIVLCLWSCILTVNCEFSEIAVKKVTDHIMNEILNNIWEIVPQVAYIVKLTEQECSVRKDKNNRGLITDIPDAFFDAIKNEKNEYFKCMKKDMSQIKIYSGNRILMATPKEFTVRKDGKDTIYSEHAEYRLLTPEGKQTVSPAEDFMNMEPKAHCVIFYSQISPCVDKCLKQNGYFNILESLRQDFQRFKDRAFVYMLVYNKEQKEQDQVIKAWGDLNKEMSLFRCTCSSCERCFKNGRINTFCIKRTFDSCNRNILTG